MKLRYMLGTVIALFGATIMMPPMVEAQITVGLKGGANFADISEVQSGASKSGETGFVGGIYGMIGFGGKWSIQPEILYSERGAGLAQGSEAISFTQKFAEIPVLLNYRILTGLIEPQIYGGASMSFETTCTITEEGVDSESCEDVIDEGKTNSTLWAGIIGAAVDLDLGLLVLGLDGRYNYGFTEIIPDEPLLPETKWQYFSLMAQIAIAVGR